MTDSTTAPLVPPPVSPQRWEAGGGTFVTMAGDPAWSQLTLTVAVEAAEAVEDAFWGWGACAVTLQDAHDQPVLEPLPGETPLWDEVQITGLFPADTDLTACCDALDHTARGLIRAVRSGPLADASWMEAWRAYLHPLCFGKHLWICPAEQPLPEAACHDPAAVIVRLHPGLAFGTGTHPTTALCLEWIAQTDLNAKTVIDYGCGSGILALAALQRGASYVWAVDIDPQALWACQRNAELNHRQAHVAVVSPEQLPSVSADILIANILAAPLIELAPHFVDLLVEGGQVVLSGLLVRQVDAVKQAFQRQGVSFDPIIETDGWVLLHGLYRDSAAPHEMTK